MTMIPTAPACGTHWLKRERSARPSGKQQGTVQAASPNLPEPRWGFVATIRCAAVIITGGAIGRAPALLFAEGGARVVITSRRSEPFDFGFIALFDCV
jgi:hypothetical protein